MTWYYIKVADTAMCDVSTELLVLASSLSVVFCRPGDFHQPQLSTSKWVAAQHTCMNFIAWLT